MHAGCGECGARLTRHVMCTGASVTPFVCIHFIREKKIDGDNMHNTTKCVRVHSGFNMHKQSPGDKYDSAINKGSTDFVYAWCEEPLCKSAHEPHAPGSWNIITVNMTGTQSPSKQQRAPYAYTQAYAKHLAGGLGLELGSDADCSAGSEDLCSCSELVRRRAIASVDECTQTAAIAYCRQHGQC